ncbi:circumsporozoite-related antigen [Plasmodium knowlesi strain H]|uniref:Circumsporozoite-related antigen n=3 Tax=Plasmodium knowlesi TaxID=5850 RepID=A0A5K1U4V2_PLAKH|nr:circumsporozoite-related antigen [Plasmodium knowlesi strain H]OTN64951.1 Circumsporozoite-related antigen [Plasmodium knowlesi]CAA9988240.1 circumsporozoite-related antigen [Plasmodium knowlesi strain H]SBO20171.1 circumsporozoite-related antigen [Plasmodium knowlesi strain H]SBO20523.1 circumsporozoite-related antigen [Plasmodium knowlesi strain H]VVS77714.1 circumsporozoite-related antigen [Plasmodium knowlesi strain H]|eukprot:XP_002259217.1 circumsporozoite-related antigen, putative [Plasmodium knowlesi strain H]
MKLLTAVFLLFCAILCDHAFGNNINHSGPHHPKKKTPKSKAPEPLIDVHELIGEMVRKEEELINVTKKKSKYKLATTVLASALGLVSAVLLGGAGLVFYNAGNGRHPFSLGGGKGGEAAPAESAPTVDEPATK